jgi:hypothetical protein
VYEALIPALATAARIASVRLAAPGIEAISDSIEALTGIPGRLNWEYKAARHAAILSQLAEAVDDVAAAHVLRMGITVMRDLAGMAGPVADDTITSSYRRLAVHLRAADPDAAEQEMASLLTSLRQMSRQVRLGLTLLIRDDRPGTRLASRAG